MQKFKKAIQKEINSKIETELKAVALKQEEGKAFKTISQVRLREDSHSIV